MTSSARNVRTCLCGPRLATTVRAAASIQAAAKGSLRAEMSVKSLLLKCDWCEAEAEVEFKGEEEEADAEFLVVHPLPDESWFHVEHRNQEHDFCCFDCLLSGFS